MLAYDRVRDESPPQIAERVRITPHNMSTLRVIYYAELDARNQLPPTVVELHPLVYVHPLVVHMPDLELRKCM